jgi:putative ABC transport system substrate-binding protein
VVSQIALKQLREASPKLGVIVVHRDVTGAKDMDKLLLEQWSGKVDAVFHLPSIFVEKYMERLIVKALKERLPLIVHEDTLLKMGALVSYGGDFRLYGAQAAKLVDKVLKGARPMNIPVEVTDRLVLTFNLVTAKALELKIPRAALDRVDRFVE